MPSSARTAVTVLNGVSDQTAAHVDKAAAVATGRCRAIVRVPWDSRLAGDGALGTAASVRRTPRWPGVHRAGRRAESAGLQAGREAADE